MTRDREFPSLKNGSFSHGRIRSVSHVSLTPPDTPASSPLRDQTEKLRSPVLIGLCEVRDRCHPFLPPGFRKCRQPLVWDKSLLTVNQFVEDKFCEEEG